MSSFRVGLIVAADLPWGGGWVPGVRWLTLVSATQASGTLAGI